MSDNIKNKINNYCKKNSSNYKQNNFVENSDERRKLSLENSTQVLTNDKYESLHKEKSVRKIL